MDICCALCSVSEWASVGRFWVVAKGRWIGQVGGWEKVEIEMADRWESRVGVDLGRFSLTGTFPPAHQVTPSDFAIGEQITIVFAVLSDIWQGLPNKSSCTAISSVAPRRIIPSD